MKVNDSDGYGNREDDGDNDLYDNDGYEDHHNDGNDNYYNAGDILYHACPPPSTTWIEKVVVFVCG